MSSMNKIIEYSWIIWIFIFLILIVAAIFQFTGILFILSGLFGFYFGSSIGEGIHIYNFKNSRFHKSFVTTILGYTTCFGGVYLIISYFR